MQRADREIVLLQGTVDDLHVPLAVAEDDRILEIIRAANDAPQGGALLFGGASRRHESLNDVLGGRGGAGARETSTRTGLGRKASARRVISGGMVAEKNSVWRVNGTSLQMRSMSGMKPMSSMRSASSMTRISIALRSRTPRPVKSSRRPGVAMTTSAPRAILVS